MQNINANIVSLAKLISDKAAAFKNARKALTVGTHNIDFTVRVHGQIFVSEDTDKTPTVSIPMKETLALFIRYSGITGPHAMNLLQRAMTDALTAANEDGSQNTRGQGAIAEALPMIDDMIETIIDPILATLPRTPVTGQVRHTLRYDEVLELTPA